MQRLRSVASIGQSIANFPFLQTEGSFTESLPAERWLRTVLFFRDSLQHKVRFWKQRTFIVYIVC